jgi:murein endopeptidase
MAWSIPNGGTQVRGFLQREGKIHACRQAPPQGLRRSATEGKTRPRVLLKRHYLLPLALPLWFGCVPRPGPGLAAPVSDSPRPAASDTSGAAGDSAEAFVPEDEPASEFDLDSAESMESSTDEDTAIEDESDDVNDASGVTAIRPPHPLDGVPQDEVLRRLREAPASLGSMSLGRPNGGGLINGERLPPDPRWEHVDESHAWGTEETVQYLTAAIGQLFEQFPDSPPVFIGHISGPNGGYLSPHRSHQSGQDVDLGFFYTTKHQWYQRASAANLDLPRTWALVRAFITHTDVRVIFLDHSLQGLLRAYATRIGEDPAWLASVFGGNGNNNPLIRHAPGHATHLHVRFYNPQAEETARRCYAGLIAMKRIPQPTYYLEHVAKKGDSLNSLAKRYGVSVKELRRINRMRGKVIFAKVKYKVPRRGPAPMPPVSRVPPRRLPPSAPVGVPVSQLSPETLSLASQAP